MGGNALKGFVERKNKEDHQRIVSKVLLFLSKFTKAEEVKMATGKFRLCKKCKKLNKGQA